MPRYFVTGSTISKLHSDSNDFKATRWRTRTRGWAGLEGLEKRKLEPSSGLHDMRRVSLTCRFHSLVMNKEKAGGK